MNVSNEFDDLFYEASERYSVPFTWLKAIAGAESDWKPNAYKPEDQINDGSRGLMQVLYKTAYALGYRGDPDGLFDPATSVNYGAKLIRENIDRFGEDFDAVYSTYNSGSPTKYKTNADVASHVSRARRYLAAVEEVTVVVEGDEAGEVSTGSTIGLGAAAVVIGIIIFLATRGGR